jgi:A/G-specific adenine glycosylase
MSGVVLGRSSLEPPDGPILTEVVPVQEPFPTTRGSVQNIKTAGLAVHVHHDWEPFFRAFAEIHNADDPDYETVANALMPAGESRIWNNAIMELGGVACQKNPRCDEASCPWREWCHAYETGDFTAPDVPTQPSFEGSRRQFRGRIVNLLGEHDELALDDIGPRIRVDYAPGGEYGREWLRGLLSDLADDGLVETTERDGDVVASLRR